MDELITQSYFVILMGKGFHSRASTATLRAEAMHPRHVFTSISCNRTLKGLRVAGVLREGCVCRLIGVQDVQQVVSTSNSQGIVVVGGNENTADDVSNSRAASVDVELGDLRKSIFIEFR
jgi:hypothetical protein